VLFSIIFYRTVIWIDARRAGTDFSFTVLLYYSSWVRKILWDRHRHLLWGFLLLL